MSAFKKWVILTILTVPILVNEGMSATEAYIHRTISRIQASGERLSWPFYPYTCGGEVRMDTPDPFKSGYLTFPSTLFIPLDRTDGYWNTYATYSQFPAMIFGYPEGPYSFGFQSQPGEWTTVEFWATADVPDYEGPILTNYPALQNLNPDDAFTIRWDTEREFGVDTRVEVEIRQLREDGIYPSVYRLSALNPNAPHPAVGEVSIPAGVIEQGEHYQLFIRFTEVTGLVTVNSNSQDWNCYTVSRAETSTQLGLSTDPPLAPEFSWQVTYDLAWATSGNAYPSPSIRFPVSKEVHFLFSPGNWADIPAEQVSVRGPHGSGFEQNFGSYILVDDAQYNWYAITSSSLNFPMPGTYMIGYRSREYSSIESAPPQSRTAPVAFAKSHLDEEGRLASISWFYRNPETGELSEGSSAGDISGQSITLVGSDGSLLLRRPNLPSGVRTLDISQEERFPWEDVSVIVHTSWRDDRSRTVTRYRLSHFEHPLALYFNDGTFVRDWLYVPWFGWLYEVSWPWIWSARHGFLYLAGSGNGQVYAWIASHGWVYFNSTTYPYVYVYATGNWSLL